MKGKKYEEYSNGLVEGWYGGYEQGLHEGQPKWHMVADGDLPKENDKLVLCYCSVGYKLLYGSEFKLLMPVYAWIYARCEIPQF